jgi:hypothetical protein
LLRKWNVRLEEVLVNSNRFKVKSHLSGSPHRTGSVYFSSSPLVAGRDGNRNPAAFARSRSDHEMAADAFDPFFHDSKAIVAATFSSGHIKSNSVIFQSRPTGIPVLKQAQFEL